MKTAIHFFSICIRLPDSFECSCIKMTSEIYKKTGEFKFKNRQKPDQIAHFDIFFSFGNLVSLQEKKNSFPEYK